jgi:hypothetical protein
MQISEKQIEAHISNLRGRLNYETKAARSFPSLVIKLSVVCGERWNIFLKALQVTQIKAMQK